MKKSQVLGAFIFSAFFSFFTASSNEAKAQAEFITENNVVYSRVHTVNELLGLEVDIYMYMEESGRKRQIKMSGGCKRATGSCWCSIDSEDGGEILSLTMLEQLDEEAQQTIPSSSGLLP